MVLPQCTTEASDFNLPFVCPPSHIFSLDALVALGRPLDAAAAATRDAPSWVPPPGVRVREAGFLTSPYTSAALRRDERLVRIADNASHAAALRASGEAALAPMTSDVQARAALRDWLIDGNSLHRTRVLRLEHAEGIFGGWAVAPAPGDWDAATADARDRFERLVHLSSVSGSSWCCSSWYKPSGSFPFAAPPPTELLPRGCGLSEADDERRSSCATKHTRRREAQRRQRLEYVRDPASKDGYYMLRGSPWDK